MRKKISHQPITALTIISNEDLENYTLISSILKKMNINHLQLSGEDAEEFYLGLIMEKTDRENTVSRSTIMKKLKK
ncbi:MAG: hypothetical protein J0L62_06060 [Bacteroidetes bacterium]|nr:hypothetical protein [Bacteroidota bacterium]